MRLLERLIPASLTHRVFALYSVTLLVFVLFGTGAYLLRELDQEIEQPQAASAMLVEVMAQAVQDSVVIGDYDTVGRTLDKGVQGSLFATALFLDLQGGSIQVDSRTRSASYAPGWLVAWVQGRLFEVNRTVSVGGKDYGALRLQFDTRAVAADIWSVTVTALALALFSLAVGLALIRFALGRWLGSLERLRGMVEDLGTGRLDAATLDASQEPTEIRRVVEMFYQTATLVRERESTRRALDDQKFALDQHAIVSITDTQGRITYANDRFCQISGYAREELLGQNHRIIGSGTHAPEFFETLWNTICQGRVWHGEICNRKRSGALYWVNATLVPLKDEHGQVAQFIAIRTDITARKVAEAEMVAAKEIAEQANRVKSDFLANMSHEIRTPMNGVIGMTELVLDTDLTSEQRDHLETVKSSADALLLIVNDILDFSKIEAGRLRIEAIEFSLEDTLRDTMRPLAVRGHQKNLEMLLHVDPGVPERLVGDPGRLRQIIVNLVGNAIKFTDSGEIEVTVCLAPGQASPQASISFSVRDTGIGIPEDKLQSIFESFSQADTSTTRRYGGTGLGLTISSQLVGLMGGQIHVSSTTGVGSNFGFTLDLPLGSTTPAVRYHASSRLHGLRVLVVDNNPTSAGLMAGMLRGWKMRPMVAGSGAQACDLLALAAQNSEPFAVTLIDAHMPVMSGFDLLGHIRRAHASVAGAMVLILAPHRQREDAARGRALDIHAHLCKPVAQSELFTAVMGSLGEVVQPRTRPDRRQVARAPQRALRVLVAEDNAVNQTLVLHLLQKMGHQVCLAHNGVEAVRHWIDDDDFDAILMDVDMPLMNGHEATRRIRIEEDADGAGRHIPIIAMTAHAMEGTRESCLRHGMDAYLSKPIDTDALWRELDAIGRGMVPPPTPLPSGKKVASAAQDHADFSHVRAALGEDEALFDEIRIQFLADAPTLLSQAQDAQARGAVLALREAVHALKGMVGIFAAGPALQACLSVEQQADTPAAAAALAELARAMDTLLVALRDYRWSAPAVTDGAGRSTPPSATPHRPH